MTDNLKAADLKLDHKHIESLNMISQPDQIFPYYMWNKQQEEFFTGGSVDIVNWEKPFAVRDLSKEMQKEAVS